MFAQDASYLASSQTAGKNTAGPKRCLSLQLFGVLSTTERGQLYTFTFVSRTRSLAAGTHLVTAGWQDCEWLHLQKKVVNDRTYLDNHVFSSPSPFPPVFFPFTSLSLSCLYYQRQREAADQKILTEEQTHICILQPRITSAMSE